MIWAIAVCVIVAAIGFVIANRAQTPDAGCLGGAIFVIGLSGLFIALVVLAISHAHAHDQNRPELNQWFDRLASGKGLCCSIDAKCDSTMWSLPPGEAARRFSAAAMMRSSAIGTRRISDRQSEGDRAARHWRVLLCRLSSGAEAGAAEA